MKNKNRVLSICFGVILIGAAAAGSLLFGKSGLPPVKQGIPERIILISIDSCDAAYITGGGLPVITDFLSREGIAYSETYTCMTAETMSGHTTMLTGAQPASSGIFGNGFYDPASGRDVSVVQDPKNRLVPTIFEYLRGSGRKSAFISGKWRLPALLSQSASLTVSSPITGISAFRPLNNGRPVYHFEGDIYDSWTLRSALSVLDAIDPDFAFINLAWLDRAGHDTGSDNFNLRRHLRYLDTGIMQFLYDLQSSGLYTNTLFIVTADHGMDSTSKYFDPKNFLEKKGIAVRKIHSEGHCAFIFLESPVSDLNTALSLFEAEPAVTDAAAGNELRRYGFDPKDPRTGDLFINCSDETVINFKGLPMIYLGMHGGTQTQKVPLYFLGPGAEKLEMRPAASVADIVPTIYDMWDIRIPDYVDGGSLYEK